MNLKVTVGLSGTFKEMRKRGKLKERRKRSEAGGEVWRTVQRSSWGARSNGNATGRGSCSTPPVQRWGRSSVGCIKFSYEHQCTA